MTQNGTVRCGMPQRDQAREVTEICGFHKPNGDEEATLEPPAFGLRPDHGQTGSNPNKKRSHPNRRIVDVISQAITAPICDGTCCRAICETACTYLT